MNAYIGEFLFLILLIVANGFFSAAEIALISARKSALIIRADEGSSGARLALQLTEDSTRMLSTIQIAITLVGILTSASATFIFADPLARLLRALGFAWVSSLASGLAILIVTIGLSYLTLVIGELVPKRLGLIQADNVAIFVARPIAWLQTVAAPVVWLLSVSTTALSTLFALTDDKLNKEAGEEEIKMLVTEQDSLEEVEKRMIHEIFDLGDTVVREIMMPRVDVLAVQDSESIAQVAALLDETGFSRTPVLHGDYDSVIGIAYLKDLLKPLTDGRGDENIVAHMRTPTFIPETKDVLSLLGEMQTRRTHMMIVVDEYGGTAGIVTMEDIVEEIVGEITDEFDRDFSQIIALNDRTWVLEGGMSADSARQQGFPIEDSDEYDTVAGWLLEQLGHIPRVGERIEHEGYTFIVQNMRRRRIARVRVTDERTETSTDETRE